ncbi:hypothetical protein NLU13_9452 [Sarocladium strictum]|uniref:Uncharacterized protein n=1 Tax=Sarocladium strictum TaxID=5046 RepID=A0AA39GAH8_SARSR|nr:hypothetical protein NLU13_9452 [Sarocladium strictum]
MASGAFSNPKTLLYVAPVVSTTCTLLYARDQDFFLSLFSEKSVPAEHQGHIQAILPSHFARFFHRGIYGVVGFIGATTWLSGGSAYSLGRGHAAFGWYMGAATLAVGHLAYVPWIAPRVKKIVETTDGEGEGAVVDVLREWLGLNYLRMWTTDLGAWVCCLVAVGKTLTPRA